MGCVPVTPFDLSRTLCETMSPKCRVPFSHLTRVPLRVQPLGSLESKVHPAGIVISTLVCVKVRLSLSCHDALHKTNPLGSMNPGFADDPSDTMLGSSARHTTANTPAATPASNSTIPIRNAPLFRTPVPPEGCLPPDLGAAVSRKLWQETLVRVNAEALALGRRQEARGSRSDFVKPRTRSPRAHVTTEACATSCSSRSSSGSSP